MENIENIDEAFAEGEETYKTNLITALGSDIGSVIGGIIGGTSGAKFGSKLCSNLSEKLYNSSKNKEDIDDYNEEWRMNNEE